MSAKKSTRRVPSTGARKPAQKVATKRIPKKVTSAPVTATAKELHQRTRNLAALSKQLASAKRSASSSRKPDSIKAANKFLTAAQREYNKEIKQIGKTATALEKFIDVFKSRGRKVKPAQKATLTKAKKIIQVSPAPVKRKVPTKKAAKKVAKKATKKAATKTPKRQPNKLVLTRPKKAPLPAHVVARSKMLGKFVPVPTEIMVQKSAGEDVNYPTAPNEQFAVKIYNRSMSDTFDDLDDAFEAMDSYTAVPESGKQVGTIAFPESADAKRKGEMILKIKAHEKRTYYAEKKVKEKQERAEKRELKKRVKELEKQLLAEQKKNKKGS